MPSFFDLHVHTVKGSGDSSLAPEELVKEAVRLGLTGVTLTEHGGWADLREFGEFARRHAIVLVHAREFETESGHILVFGLNRHPPGAVDPKTLRQAVTRAGGWMVSAHPFRNLFNPPPYNMSLIYQDPGSHPKTPEEAIAHPLFELLDDVEVVNGANSEEENRFALEVARRMGTRGTGGSDAHSAQGLGRGVTRFEEEIRSEAEFLEALRAGAYTPAEGFNRGEPRYFRAESPLPGGPVPSAKTR
jgi:hypothetical protein